MTLYESLLEQAWHQLSPSVRDFLEADKGTYRGTLSVRNGDWWLSRAAARVLRFPRAGLNLPVLVRREGQSWVRMFPDVTLSSEQRSEGRYLLERMGIVLCTFSLRVADGALMFQHRATDVLVLGRRLRIPRMLAPLVTGYCEPGSDHTSTFVHVSIWLPVARIVLTYSGPVYKT